MKLLRRTILFFLAATAPTGLLALHPLASNTFLAGAIKPRNPAFGYFAQAPPTDAPAQLKPAKSVLGIEVRSSHEKNVGRIVDLLADKGGAVEAAVIEFGGFLGIGTRKIAIAWSDLRFETEGNQLLAILDIPRDQLRAAPDYKPDRPTIVTKTIQPLTPSTEEPPYSDAQVPGAARGKPPRKRNHNHHRPAVD
jgi:PRC-barrel domain